MHLYALTHKIRFLISITHDTKHILIEPILLNNVTKKHANTLNPQP